MALGEQFITLVSNASTSWRSVSSLTPKFSIVFFVSSARLPNSAVCSASELVLSPNWLV
jgi:hypothetical protein